MAQLQFLVLTDENVHNAISQQLQRHGINASRVINHLPAGTPDDEVLEYAHQNGYTLITHDERIKGHTDKRTAQGKDHCGVFIAPHDLQGPNGIGRIVEAIVEYDDFIKGGAATLQDDVYNQVIYIPA